MYRSLAGVVVMGLVVARAGVATADPLELIAQPVPVVTASDSSIFPESWLRAPIHATGGMLAPPDAERALDIVKRALAKYPDPVLARHLKAVYVLSELKYSGVVAGGTNSRTAVYLMVGSVKNGFTDAHIERVFHAEFSSILLRNLKTRFDEEKWQQFNPPGFRYSSGDGVGAIKQGRASVRPDDQLAPLGFRNQYAQSSLENDFNGFAAALWTGDATVWDQAQRYPAIRGKLELTLAFYQSIDPSFTAEHFRALAGL